MKTNTELPKETIIHALEILPSEETIDEALERLLLLSKIEQGRKDIAEGRFYTEEEVEAMLNEWQK